MGGVIATAMNDMSLGYLLMQLTCVFFPYSGLISGIPHTGLHLALWLGLFNRPQLAWALPDTRACGAPWSKYSLSLVLGDISLVNAILVSALDGSLVPEF